MAQKYVITLDISSSIVKMGAASVDPESGSVQLLGAENEPLPDCVRYGRIQNVDDVKVRTMMTLDRLSRHPSLANVDIVGVYAAIGGRGLRSMRASASLRLPDERLITSEIVERLKDEALKQVPDSVEVLEVVPLRYKVEGVEMTRPVGAYGSQVDGEFTVVVCQPLNSRNINRVVVERLDLDICGYIVRPLAIAEATLTPDDTNPGCMLADIGAETVTVAIYKNNALQYLATIPMGSRNITRDLANGLAIPEERAEQIKKQVGNAMPESSGNNIGNEQIEIDSFVHARATEIVANLLAHIEFAGFDASQLRAGIILTGGGAKLKNLAAMVKQQSRMAVRTAIAPASVRIADPGISHSDNLDLISLTLEASRRASTDGADPCTRPKPQPEPEVKPEPVQPAQPAAQAAPAQPVQEVRAEKPYDDADEDDTYEAAPRRRNDDDDDLLYDDDRAEERRRERARRNREIAEAEARRLEKQRQRQLEEQIRKKKREEEEENDSFYEDDSPSIMDRLRKKIGDFWSGSSDGRNLD